MKKYIALLFVTIHYYNCYSQTIVRLPEFYKARGVIFNHSTQFLLKLPSVKEYYTPSINNIKHAEKIISTTVTVGNETGKTYKNYRRQYIGCLNENGDSLIYVLVFRVKNMFIQHWYFNNWRQSFISGYGDYYERYVRRFLINISTGKLEKY